MKMSSLKSKAMKTKGQILIKSKIVIDNKILEQINMFTYLMLKLSYEGEGAIA
jgi:hypothetical protein